MELSTSFSKEIRDSSDILCDSPPEFRLRRERSAVVEDIFSPSEKRAGGFQNVTETVRVIGTDCISYGQLKGWHIVESTFGRYAMTTVAMFPRVFSTDAFCLGFLTDAGMIAVM